MVVETVRKWLGFIPLMMWGRWGTTIPHKVAFLVAAELVNSLVYSTQSQTKLLFLLDLALVMLTRAVAAQL